MRDLALTIIDWAINALWRMRAIIAPDDTARLLEVLDEAMRARAEAARMLA